MTIEELSRQVVSLGDLVLVWFDCLRQPFLTIDKVFSDYPGDKQRLQYAIKLWTVSFLLGLVFQLPMYEFLGMDWQKVGFLLPTALIFLLIFLGISVAIHLGLKATRVKSNLVETCVIYAVIIAAHAPFFTLLLYQGQIDNLSMLQTAKGQENGLLDAFVEFFTQIQAASVGRRERSIPELVGDAVAVPISFLYSALVLVLLQRALAARYEVARYPVFFGTSLGIGLFGIVPIVGFSLIYWFVMYLAL